MAVETKREQPVRLVNPSAQPFVTALKTARFFAVLFFWVTMVALLAHVAAFVLTEWVRFFEAPAVAEEAAAGGAGRGAGFWERAALGAEPAPPPAKEAPAPPPKEPAAPETAGKIVAAPAAEPAKEPVDPAEEAARRERYREAAAQVLGPLRALGMVTAVLLWVTMFIYLQIGLLGRLAGIRQLTNALFVMLVFLATALPWQYVFEDVRLGSFFEFGALVEARAARAAGGAETLCRVAWYYARFLAMPLVSVALLATAGLQFASGYSESVVANE